MRYGRKMQKATNERTYRYFDYVMSAFVAVLLCSNLIGASKVATLFGFQFGAGVLFFPVSYIFGDVLTEVYGYAKTRKVVWAGFGAMAFATLMIWVVLQLPPAATWPHQQAFETVFGSTWRIVLASFLGYWAGEFCNSYVLARMKVYFEGRRLWARTIGSTIVGQAVDTILFYPIAFFGIWETNLVITVMISNYFIKVGWEAALTPLTYKAVAWLKRAEEEDFFDRQTDFNPFHLQ